MAFRFLDLPPELRFNIYNDILQPDKFRRDLGDGETSYEFDTSLFYVSKQVYQESHSVYSRNFIFVRLETPWGEASDHLRTEGRLPTLMTGPRAEAFPSYTFTVSISTPGMLLGTDGETRNCIIFLADDLPAFCEMWFYSNISYGGQLNSAMRLNLTIADNLAIGPGHAQPIAVQERLLLPFGVVKGLHSVTINGSDCSEAIISTMRTTMKIPEDPPEKCLEDSANFELEGNKALKSGKPQAAVDLYLKAFKAMHIICIGHYRRVWGESWFYKILDGGRFDGQDGNMVRLLLRVRLVASIIQAYLDMSDYAEALFWGERTIHIIDHPHQTIHPIQFPFRGDVIGLIYYRTGIASKLLGKRIDARRYFMTAYRYLPQDDEVREQLASVTPLLIGSE